MTMQSMLKTFEGRDVGLHEMPNGGFRVSTRKDGDRFNVWSVGDDIVVLQNDVLKLRRIVSLAHIVELEIVLELDPNGTA